LSLQSKTSPRRGDHQNTSIPRRGDHQNTTINNKIKYKGEGEEGGNYSSTGDASSGDSLVDVSLSGES
jgi:hypothetical protein